jgi:hypothetical protein
MRERDDFGGERSDCLWRFVNLAIRTGYGGWDTSLCEEVLGSETMESGRKVINMGGDEMCWAAGKRTGGRRPCDGSQQACPSTDPTRDADAGQPANRSREQNDRERMCFAPD